MVWSPRSSRGRSSRTTWSSPRPSGPPAAGQEVMDASSRRAGANALVELVDVSKIYRMGDVEVPALQQVSVTIAESEFIAVMGPSGSGKSTLMNIIGCLDRPTSGRFRLAGREMGGLSRSALARVRNEML